MASVIDTVVNLAKRRGLVYPAGEIYGGTKSAWDYGPLGVELKENIKRQWWRSVVTGRDDVVGLLTAIWNGGRSGFDAVLRTRANSPRGGGGLSWVKE